MELRFNTDQADADSLRRAREERVDLANRDRTTRKTHDGRGSGCVWETPVRTIPRSAAGPED